MPHPARLLQLFLRIALVLTLIIGGLLLGMAFSLRQNPEALAEHLADLIRSHAGIECSMGLVDVAMLPMPALAITDISISTEELQLSVAYATVRPSVLALLRGEFAPGDITLLRPELVLKSPLSPTATLPAPLPAPPAVKAEPQVQNFRLPAVLQNCRLMVQHGSVEALRIGDRRVQLRDIRTDISPSSDGGADTMLGWLHVGSATVYDGPNVAAQLDSLQFDISGALFDLAQGATGSVRIQGRVSLPHVLHINNFDVQMEQVQSDKSSSRVVTANIMGNFPFDGQTIPFHMQGMGKGRGKLSSPLTVESLDLMLDRDRIHLQGQLALPTGESLWPEVSGSLNLHRLSLTQWFGFGRSLPGGLQRSLDELSGNLEFSMNSKGLQVPKLHVNVAGTSFDGKGSVQSWAQPVISIEARSRQIELGAALPESLGKFPSAPLFRHKALTPEPGSVAAANSDLPDINYDIQLRVDTVQYGPLTAQDAQFRCLPSGQAGIVDMRFGVGGLYGGSLEAKLLLTAAAADRPTQYDIRAQLKNMHAEKPLHLVTGSKFLGGRLSATAQWRAEGNKSAVFFSSLNGASTIKVEDGYYDSPTTLGNSDKFAFSRLELSTRHRGQAGLNTQRTQTSAQNSGLSLDGEWQGLLHTKDWQGSVRLDGPLTFASKTLLPLSFQKVPGSVSVQLSKEITSLTQNIKSHLTGRFSYNTGTSNFDIEDAHLSAEGLEVRGTVQSTLKDLSLKGDLQLTTSQLRRVLTLLGYDPNSVPAHALQHAEASARLSFSPTSLNLQNLKARVDSTHVAGSIEGQWNSRATWKFDLNADSFDLAHYKKTQPEGAAPSAKPWDLKILQSTDAQGTLRFGTLRLYKFNLQNAHIPVRLQKGQLECAPLKATAYTAPVKGFFQAEAKNGLHVKLDVQATNVDMLPLTADLNIGTILAGKGMFKALTQGIIKSDADIPAALDGNYGLEILHGYFQSRTPQGEPTGSKSGFSFLRGTGQLQKGILYNNDFVMDSSSMRVTGKGQINFVSRQLDYTALVKMRNIAEFPVRYSGSLSNPQREIKAGKAIVETLGNLGADVFGLVGDVISTPFKFFR